MDWRWIGGGKVEGVGDRVAVVVKWGSDEWQGQWSCSGLVVARSVDWWWIGGGEVKGVGGRVAVVWWSNGGRTSGGGG